MLSRLCRRSWDEGTRTANLQLSILKPLAVIQPRAIDWPYRWWNLTPTGEDSCILTLAGSRFELELEIQGAQVHRVTVSALQALFE